MLSGVLSGSAFLSGVHGPYESQSASGAGHFFVAPEVFYPGEIEARNDARNRKEGLLLPADTVADLRKLAKNFGLAEPWL